MVKTKRGLLLETFGTGSTTAPRGREEHPQKTARLKKRRFLNHKFGECLSRIFKAMHISDIS